MGFELDKHDLFRNAVPGAVFLLVIFCFYLFNVGFREIKNLGAVMVIAITLPIGYLIQSIYRAYHVIVEQNNWYKYEADLIRKLLNRAELEKLTDEELNNDTDLSWLIEMCLHVKSSEPVRERAYVLSSRFHSSGASITAIVLAIPISILLLNFTPLKNNFVMSPCLIINFLTVVICLVVIFCLIKVRRNSIDGYRTLIKHFVIFRKDLIRRVLLGKIDPFLERAEELK